MDERLCCCIPNQKKLDDGCQNVAEYIVCSESTPNGYTESCGKHLEEMLDDSIRFEVVRIPITAG